jgi:hypothetical protein
MTLLDNALKACGGLERWNRFDRFEVHVSIGGSYLASKVDATNLREIVVSGNTRFQAAEVVGALDRTRRGLCRMNWVGIENPLWLNRGSTGSHSWSPREVRVESSLD